MFIYLFIFIYSLIHSFINLHDIDFHFIKIPQDVSISAFRELARNPENLSSALNKINSSAVNKVKKYLIFYSVFDFLYQFSHIFINLFIYLHIYS